MLADKRPICAVLVFLCSCKVLAQGRVAIAIRKYGFLLTLVERGEKEEGWCLGQPSTQQALISHLDVIYSGLQNNVYCNGGHNYHRSTLSEDPCHVCVCLWMGRTVYTAVVCLRLYLWGDICACINGGNCVILNQNSYRRLHLPTSWTLKMTNEHVWFFFS